jgi:integrase
MRLGEVARVKIADIDSRNMRIKVGRACPAQCGGKGAKDRYTILSEQVLAELRAYYIIYKPKEYLFNGSRPGCAYEHAQYEHLVQKSLAQIGS